MEKYVTQDEMDSYTIIILGAVVGIIAVFIMVAQVL